MIESAEGCASIAGNGEVERVACAKSQQVLISEPRGGAELRRRHGQDRKAIRLELIEYGQRICPLTGV